MKNQLGFSLVELLLALFLSSLLMIFIHQIWTADEKENRLYISLLELQENAQFAQHILTQSISLTGLMGCHAVDENVLQINVSPLAIRVDEMNPKFSTINKKLNSKTIIIDSILPRYQVGDEVLITNCEQTVVMKAQAVKVSPNQQTLVLNHALDSKISSGAMVGMWQSLRFFLAKSRVKDDFSLYEEDARGKKFDLIPGVISWQIFGMIRGSWVNVLQIENTRDIAAIKIALLLKSSTKVFNQVKDPYLYREFTFFIPLIERNNYDD